MSASQSAKPSTQVTVEESPRVAPPSGEPDKRAWGPLSDGCKSDNEGEMTENLLHGRYSLKKLFPTWF